MAMRALGDYPGCTGRAWKGTSVNAGCRGCRACQRVPEPLLCFNIKALAALLLTLCSPWSHHPHLPGWRAWEDPTGFRNPRFYIRVLDTKWASVQYVKGFISTSSSPVPQPTLCNLFSFPFHFFVNFFFVLKFFTMKNFNHTRAERIV